MKIKRSAMYRLAPQMKEYDRYTHEWRQYIMYSNKSNLRSKSISTDNLGLRFNYSTKDDFLSKTIFEENNNKAKSGILIGASTAYGMGASSNETTISSLLSKKTDTFFYNLGITAFTGFQEVLLHQSLINNLENIDYLVIFSGLNDLYLSNYVGIYDELLGPYYYSSQFKSGMDSQVLNTKRKIAKFLFSNFLDKETDWVNISIKELLNEVKKKKDTYDKDKFTNNSFDYLKNYLKRNLIYWSNLQKIYKTKIIYILQPFPKWCNKELSNEEREIFNELDQNNLKIYKSLNSIEDHQVKYTDLLRSLCLDYNINFIDSNEFLKSVLKKDDWCFIDRSHLTDLGNQYICNLIKANL
jgi:hypothetical protein